ncbi:MAG: HAD family phosphatase [Saprospiraceae bacterium]|nr:HAD family phosphatase [Saprospiraceae bacterium]
MNFKQPKNIVFDLGGVLIDWNPRYLFTEVFQKPDELDFFLTKICSPEWNEEQDGGRSLAEGTEVLVKKFPDFRREIELYYGQWHRMLGGSIQSNVSIFEALRNQGRYQLFALTNWSAETFPIAIRQFAFLQDFSQILVSGVEGMRKPAPAFYQLMFDRFNIVPQETLFIDDSLRNIDAAEKMGLQCIHLPLEKSLRAGLIPFGITLE